ncbi:TonB-dependent siderophore receptor, partial [Escherichia coli]|nr:TonB-dependent siderophore receptor [Escherichia coli]
EHDLAIGAMVNRLTDGWTNRNPVAMDPIADFNHWDGKLAQPVWGPRSLSSGGSTTQAALYATTRISLFGPLKVIGGGRLR